MNGRKLTVLTAIAGVLAVGEFGSSILIWQENRPGSLPLGAVVAAGARGYVLKGASAAEITAALSTVAAAAPCSVPDREPDAGQDARSAARSGRPDRAGA